MICCIFDLDDTLYREHDFMRSGHKFIANKLDFIIDKEEFVNSLNDDIKLHKYTGRFERALEKCNISYDENKIKKIISLYRNHKPDIKLYPNALIFLKTLIKNNSHILIVTEGFPVTQENKILSLGLEEFPIIITENKMSGSLKKEILSSIPKHITKFLVFGDDPVKDGFLSKNFDSVYIRARNRSQKCYNYPNVYPVLREYNPEIDYKGEKFLNSILTKIKEYK